jgi:hypothetical protein
VTSTPKASAGLASPGQRLWHAIADEFDLSDPEAVRLEEACRIRLRIAQLQATVKADEIMLESSQGLRLHPAIAETRQQRLARARILATLKVPALDEDNLPPSRGGRGVYAP